MKAPKHESLIIILIVFFAFLSGFYTNQLLTKKVPYKDKTEDSKSTINLEILQEKVIPKKGYRFSIKWEMGKKMIEDGVIDEKKLAQAIAGTDKLPDSLQKYLNSSQGQIELNQETAQFWVDVLWGLGLANKNKILDEGPMMENGNAANFASTGGYTLGKKDAMEYYSKFSYIVLSKDQQRRVERISQGIYRPCCGNSTYFPDCNHGMAALGLIELMVAQNKSDEEIYKTVLAFNSYWFPQTYLDIAYHFEKNERDYAKVKASEILSKTFSSAMGYEVVRRKVGSVAWPALKGAGSCGA